VVVGRKYPLNRGEFHRFLQQHHCEENFEFITGVHDLRAKASSSVDTTGMLPDVQRIAHVYVKWADRDMAEHAVLTSRHDLI